MVRLHGLIILLSLFTFDAVAEVKLYVLRPSKSHLEYLIPVREGHRFVDELELYKKSIRANVDLSNTIVSEQLDQFKIGQIRELTARKESQVLILANRGNDLGIPADGIGQGRIKKLSEKLSSSTSLIILPLAAGINLTPEDRLQFYDKISSVFTGVIALGGADVSPDLYHDVKKESRDVNLTRDQFEIVFLKRWIQNKSGFLYGICRGHQLISVALGFKLIQHIDSHGDGRMEGHKIIFPKTESNIYKKIFNADVASMNVNSYHHQAVRYTNHNPDVELAASANDGTVESLASKDGSIFTTQFHPEFMDGYVSKKIFSFLNFKFKSSSLKSCKGLFSL